MADLSSFTGKNRRHTGTTGITVSDASGAVPGNRVNGTGRLRFNSDLNLLEYYTGAEWKSIDSPPTITNFSFNGRTASTSQFVAAGDTGSQNVVITGSLFATTGTVTVVFKGNGGGNVSADSVTVNSGSQITATFNTVESFNASYEPWDLEITNPSGLKATLDDCLTSDSAPVFNNAVNTTFEIYDSGKGSVDTGTTFAATDADSDTITYSVSVGALPSGLSLNTSSGAVTGNTSAVGSDTTTTFTIQASTASVNVTRQFKITQKAPFVSSFTSTGAGTFTAVAGTTLNYIVVAGGGGGAACSPDQDTGKGGGGAGGMCVGTFTFPSSTPAPDLSIPYSVGAGGNQNSYPNGTHGNQGTDSVLTLPSVTVTANGGGGGGTSDDISNSDQGRPGGSGGGGGTRPPGSAGTSTQTSGTGYTGYGNPGGQGGPSPPNSGGGGGGGAGTQGGNYSGSKGGDGGQGRQSDITGSAVYYAGGGGGGNFQQNPRSSGGQGGGGRGNQGNQNNFSADISGIAGTANTGGGGGGAADGQGSNQPAGIGGAGGSGIIIVSY